MATAAAISCPGAPGDSSTVLRDTSIEGLRALIDPAIVRRVPRAFLEHARLLPLSIERGRLHVAALDERAGIDDLLKAMGVAVAVVHLVSAPDYRRLWSEIDLARLTAPVEAPRVTHVAEAPSLAPYQPDVDEHCACLYDALLLECVGRRASDLHLERSERGVRIRARIDGDLYDLGRPTLTPLEMTAVANVAKIRSGIDIAEHRLPQGGRASATIAGQRFDLRVQTQPSLYGEHLIVRFLQQQAELPGIEQLGFPHRIAQVYRRLIAAPSGLILVVGPTGSGKSTTLYAALQVLARDTTRKVITAEDPIEYSIDGVQQTQVRPEIGYTFAAATRAFLREDPDVILIGEIRDHETAIEAIRASQTGHIVLSTLHCNDASDAPQRMLDLDVHPNSIASELTAVFAQRLARRICPHCKREVAPEPEILAEVFPGGAPRDFHCYAGSGCEKCDGRGTRGRVAVIEHMTVDRTVRAAVIRRVDVDGLRTIAVQQGLSSLRRSALEHVAAGTISLSELPSMLPPERLGEDDFPSGSEDENE